MGKGAQLLTFPSVGYPTRAVSFLGLETRRRLHGSGFVRGASVLFAGTVLAQASSLAVWPLLTRLYDPEQSGILGTYLGLITILVTVASLRYENAIPIARHDWQAFDLLAPCGFGLLATGSLFLYRGYTGFDAVVAVWAYSTCQVAAVIPVTLMAIRSTGLVVAE
jgi:O-antigen/teichoic acid export membrane protein